MFALHVPDWVLFYGFCSFLRTSYTDHLRGVGARRDIAYAWMARAMDILRNDPRAKREDYNWVLDAVPSSHSASTIIRRAQKLISSRIRDLEITYAARDGHVLRVEGNFKDPNRSLRNNGAGFLLGDLQNYNSESRESYVSGARHKLRRRFLAGIRHPHIIIDNPHY